MNLTTLKWSLSDWHKLIESGILDDKNVELLEGEIINMAPEGIPHSATNREIDDYLRELPEGVTRRWETRKKEGCSD